MTFLWQDVARWQTFVDNKCLQQVKNLKYLGCDISYETEKDTLHYQNLFKNWELQRALLNQIWSRNFQE